MKTVISATTMARQLGDLLGRIRYRHESFIIERNGVVVARLIPAEPEPRGSLRAALDAWRAASEPDADFADALERIGAADMTPRNPWDS
jgi:antitoxin (DNA-binding transcriptional repressor) of toxin-antitoxin stability system